ncbi:MAG: molecular chaperone HtpG, partial [Methanomethylophilus sp.]|nr:molecular chaperone HtpG [Methanomethylophilus sp.]
KDEEYKELTGFAKQTLGDGVAAVKISHKLKNHAVLLTTQGSITFEVEKYFREMPGAAGDGVKAARVLELNSDSDAFKALNEAFKTDKDKAAKIVKVMYGQACLMAGQPLDDPVAYSDLVLSML